MHRQRARVVERDRCDAEDLLDRAQQRGHRPALVLRTGLGPRAGHLEVIAQRADVVALIDHEDHIELRILEVKSHGEPFDDVAIDGDHVSGDAIVQLERTADVLDAIFSGRTQHEFFITSHFTAVEVESVPARALKGRLLSKKAQGVLSSS